MEEKLNAILEEIREIKKIVYDIEDSLAKDREKIQDQNVQLATNTSEVKETRQAVNRMGQIVKDKVADVVEPVIGMTDQLSQTIEKKKMTIINGNKPGFFSRLFKRR